MWKWSVLVIFGCESVQLVPQTLEDTGEGPESGAVTMLSVYRTALIATLHLKAPQGPVKPTDKEQVNYEGPCGGHWCGAGLTPLLSCPLGGGPSLSHCPAHNDRLAGSGPCSCCQTRLTISFPSSILFPVSLPILNLACYLAPFLYLVCHLIPNLPIPPPSLPSPPFPLFCHSHHCQAEG